MRQSPETSWPIRQSPETSCPCDRVRKPLTHAAESGNLMAHAAESGNFMAHTAESGKPLAHALYNFRIVYIRACVNLRSMTRKIAPTTCTLHIAHTQRSCLDKGLICWQLPRIIWLAYSYIRVRNSVLIWMPQSQLVKMVLKRNKSITCVCMPTIQ